MRRRGCLMTIGIFAGLILICCGLGWFVVVPRFQDSVSDQLSEKLTSELALQTNLPTVEPGEYKISVTSLNSKLNSDFSSQSVDNFVISVGEDNDVRASFTTGEQNVVFTGMIQLTEGGKIEILDPALDPKQVGWFVPADKVADGIETGINEYFTAQDLKITDFKVVGDEITVVVAS